MSGRCKRVRNMLVRNWQDVNFSCCFRGYSTWQLSDGFLGRKRALLSHFLR